MKLKIFQVDAFTDQLFSGNPAAVCPLEKWLTDEKLQKIAAENNLAETAFYIPNENGFHLRWLTPAVEVDLCGHATLATAHVMFQHLGFSAPLINFHSRSGMLSVRKNGSLLTLNFPKNEMNKIETPIEISKAITVKPVECFLGKNVLMAVLSSQKDIEELNPDINFIAQAHPHGVIFTARGSHVDFVSRCFLPNCGIHEDPVTGSAHTILTPYWSARLGKSKLTATQLSKRTGQLMCELIGDRVEISGKAVTYMTGEIEI